MEENKTKEAFNTLVMSVKKANKSGAFELEESVIINQALTILKEAIDKDSAPVNNE